MVAQKAHAQCPVNAGFTTSAVYVCLGSSVSFTNTTTGGAVFHGWFENGVAFSSQVNPSRTFNIPGQFLISLVSTNGSCQDTANTVIVVDPDITTSSTLTPVSCFGFSDGAINLTPAGGTPNIALNNDRNASDWAAINSVSAAGYGSGITIEFWAQPRSTWTLSDGMVIAFNTSGSGNRFLFGYNAAQQRFVYFDDNSGNRFQAGTAARGVWHHVALTINATNQVLMYVNGVNVLTYTTTFAWTPQATDFCSIGQEFDGAGVTSQHFDGALDEFRIWNTVLTPGTITANYNTCGPISPSHPNIANLVAYYSFNEGGGSFLFDRTGRNNHGSRVIGNTWTTPATTTYGCFYPGTGYAYSWSTGATTEDISALSAGTYSATVIDGAGCTEVANATISQPAAVVVNIATVPNDTICVGDTATFTATGASTYTWTPSASLSSGTGSSVSAFPITGTTYTIIGTNATGCRDTVILPVGVNNLPTAAISGANVLCFGDTTTLSATGGTSYSWSSGDNTASVALAPGSSTVYTVTVTDVNGCQDTEQYPVTVNLLPVVAFVGDDTLCAGDSTTITASGGNAYAWSNGDNTAATTLQPGGTATYSVVVTDSNSCSSTDSIEIVVNALPVVTFSGQDSICFGNSTTITSSGGNSYVWSTGDTTAAITVSPSASATYTVVVTDINVCSSTDSFAVVVNPLPIITATGGDTICFGDSLVLSATGGASYLWSNGAATSSTTVFPPNSDFYTVTGTDLNGCSATDSVFVVVNAPPAISISGPSQICAGNSAQFMASGGNSYVWSTGDTTSSLLVSPAAGSYTYTVTVTNGAGCTNNASISLTVNPSPTATIAGQNAVCVGSTATLNAGGGGSYSWSTGASTASINVTPASTNTYIVTVTVGTCTDTASHTVVVNPLPATPTITQTFNTMSAPAGFVTYQWFLGGSPIIGASSSSYTATQNGTYTVQVTDQNGCSSTSANYPFELVGVGEGLEFLNQAQVFPNPNNGSFSVSLNLDKGRELSLVVYDVLGHAVYQHTVKASAGSWQQDVQLVDAAKGLYFLHIRSGEASIVKKLIVE